MEKVNPGEGNAGIREVYETRVRRLTALGIIGLIFKQVDSGQVNADGLGIDFAFKGEPFVTVKVLRSKQGKGIFYKEEVVIEYDGEELSINGAHQIFLGQIPKNKRNREEVIGGAIKNAFENPKRTVIANFDPRKFY